MKRRPQHAYLDPDQPLAVWCAAKYRNLPAWRDPRDCIRGGSSTPSLDSEYDAFAHVGARVDPWQSTAYVYERQRQRPDSTWEPRADLPGPPLAVRWANFFWMLSLEPLPPLVAAGLGPWFDAQQQAGAAPPRIHYTRAGLTVALPLGEP